jgi:hypothetical protein
MNRPHHCPHCICVHDTIDDMGYVNKAAEFYPLVQLIDSATKRNQYDRPEPDRVPA